MDRCEWLENGWVDGCISKWVDGWMCEQVDGWISELLDGWIDMWFVFKWM